MMRKREVVLAALVALLAIGLVSSVVAHRRLKAQVRAFETTHGGSIAENLSKEDVDARVKAEVAASRAAMERGRAPAAKADADAVAKGLPQMRVVKVQDDGDTLVDFALSERPDMEVVGRYVTVEPSLVEGALAFEYDSRYNRERDGYEPHLLVRGEFAFRTNVTVRLRRGLPLLGRGANPEATGSLAADVTHVFRRRDREPSVAYVADGRYLPPGGAQALEIESVNVHTVRTEVCRVESRNVVQMLAREEQVYERYSWRSSADGEETAELAGEAETNDFMAVCRPNVRDIHRLRVGLDDGRHARGIYLLAVHNADFPPCDDRWDDLRYNPRHYRVVCLSDLGLSVRQSCTDGLGVWVTSLTTGTPVADAWVEIYSTANVKVMEGRTDARGWCAPGRIARGAPFVAVVIAPDGDDMSFLALRDSMEVDETPSDGARAAYLGPGETEAFVWSDRGIYRHGERILAQAIVRDGARVAPAPMPVTLELIDPKGNVHAAETRLTDAEGTVRHDGFAVPAEQPSGIWTVRARLPGSKGRTLGEREIKIEEFAPPQIRVTVAPDVSAHPSNFAFTVSAEHLFGGPAHGLACEGAVVFEDVPFAPHDWKGWRFGNEDLGLRPSFRTLGRGMLDREGRHRFAAPLFADSGLPRAAVRVTGQGVVFEDGGRPATMRQSAVLHYYPFYIGATLPDTVRLEKGRRPSVEIVCVEPSGRRLPASRRLTARLERIDSVYSYRRRANGWHSWDCDRVRATVADGLAVVVPTNASARLELPIAASGDYALTVTDPESRASFARTFYASDWGDTAVRAPLANPTAVTAVPDRARYRVGETPHLTVKAPFAGWALLSVMREREVYSEVLLLTNATSEITLRPVTRADAPNLDVYLSVIQSVEANARHLAVRAYGQATVAVQPVEEEIPVTLDATVVDLKSVEVAIDAPGATAATVTVVDEGINILTGEPTPDPVSAFAQVRQATHPLFDLYHRILPVVGGEGPRVSGVKTGGGFGAEMLGRVSPVPTRRFRPLALWTERLALDAAGKGRATVRLPEFVGEVRVTAVVVSPTAAGSASVRRKVTPKLVTLPDAPRFVAPGDVFEISLPIHNRCDGEATFDCEIAADDRTVLRASGVRLAKDGFTNIVTRLTAPRGAGELALRYHVTGMGETHEQVLRLPVRPAVAWVETAGVRRLAPGEKAERQPDTPTTRYSLRVHDSPLGELATALAWLAEYPHGCLEQTASRIFPLITAGGILAVVPSDVTSNRAAFVTAGVRRVESMVRATDFVMWPDATYAPWDPEVSLYAAHFLVEAERAGEKLNPAARGRVMRFLRRWAMSTNETISAYACHTLALAGVPEKDRQFRLYDAADRLSLLSRARLARAFALSGDRTRATALLKRVAGPDSVREAAFVVLALLELNPDDPRILSLLGAINARRPAGRLSWSTTTENAHALLAFGAYWRHRPPQKGERYAAWRRLALPDPREVKDESRGLTVSRRLLTPEGAPARKDALRRGELLVTELSIRADGARVLNDLVIEDLFAGAFEPVHGAPPLAIPAATNEVVAAKWVLRSDARDDRMLVFSRRFSLERGEKAVFRYPVRVVSAGEYTLPGPSVEAMYDPELSAHRAPSRITVIP